jgi:hypothetical protein
VTNRVEELLVSNIPLNHQHFFKNKADQRHGGSVSDKIEEIKQDAATKQDELNSMFAQVRN